MFLIPSGLCSQNIEGDWYGTLTVGYQSLRLRFTINSGFDGKLSGTMDSFDQSAMGIPLDTVTFGNNLLRFVLNSISFEFKGIPVSDSIKGVIRQFNQTFPLDLTRKRADWLSRPQEPVKPYGYKSEDIKFTNVKENFILSGTLTMPQGEGPFPAIVLVSGSGPQNRDEEIMGHKPFLVLSDFLTKMGFAVLRYDDRGTGESEGNFDKSTTYDLLSDAEAAFDYLKGREDINGDKIGIAGHSEGGIIATLMADSRKETAFVVLLAAPMIKGSDLIILQQEMIARGSGVPEEDISDYRSLNQSIMELIDQEKEAADTIKLREMISAMIISATSGTANESISMAHAKQYTTPWMLFFLRFNPATALREVKVPILAIYGSKDLQVPSRVNKEAFNKNVIPSNKNVSVFEIEGLNHLLQEAETGLPKEYFSISHTISHKALNVIGEWLKDKIM